MARLFDRIRRFARTRPRDFILVLLVLAAALGAALILGPHFGDSVYNNIIPSGGE